MGKWKPRHSAAYYAAVTKEGNPAHYNRPNWENRKTFVKETRPTVQNLNVLQNSGFIKGAYTDYKSPNPRDFHADHGVALKEAWQSGGYKWKPEKKNQYAHDVSVIVMSEAKVNKDKGYKGPNKWLPPKNISQYLLKREATKIKYNLTSNKEEAAVFQKHIGRMPNVKISPKVEKTKYCASCHVNHATGKHK